MSDGVVEIKVAAPSGAYSVWVGPGLMERAAELIRSRARRGGRDRLGRERAGAARRAGLDGPGAGQPADGVVRDRAGRRGAEDDRQHRGAASSLRQQRVARGAISSSASEAASRRDLAGFVAAGYHRGLAVAAACRRTLSARWTRRMGEPRVTSPEGKNLVGAFHQPVGVPRQTSLRWPRCPRPSCGRDSPSAVNKHCSPETPVCSRSCVPTSRAFVQRHNPDVLDPTW